MGNTVSMNNAIEILETEDKLMRDIKGVQARDVGAVNEGGKLALRYEGNTLPILPFAVPQVSALLGISQRDVAKEIKVFGPDMVVDRMNAWFDHLGDKELFIRLRDEKVRAVLSGRYAPISNLKVLQALRDLHPNHPIGLNLSPTGLKITDYCVGGEDTRLEIEKQTLERVGDTVTSGIYLKNSETGHGAVEMGLQLERLICSNGMTVFEPKQFYRQVHLSQNGFGWDQVSGGIIDIMNTAPKYLGMLGDTRKLIMTDFTKTLENLKKRYRLNNKDIEKITYAYNAENIELQSTDSMYRLLNAVTSTAKTLDNIKRQEFEKIGGSMITDSKLLVA